jgi:hypothetical protein
MTLNFRHLALSLMLLVSFVTFADAQTISLTKDQRLQVYRTLIKEPISTPPPANVNLMIGDDIPTSMELYAMPTYVVVSTPGTAAYKFTVWNNQVVLVSRRSRKIVAIIRE